VKPEFNKEQEASGHVRKATFTPFAGACGRGTVSAISVGAARYLLTIDWAVATAEEPDPPEEPVDAVAEDEPGVVTGEAVDDLEDPHAARPPARLNARAAAPSFFVYICHLQLVRSDCG
jgi:hypothetical protein